MLWKAVHPEAPECCIFVADSAEQAKASFIDGLVHPEKFADVQMEPLTLEDIESFLKAQHERMLKEHPELYTGDGAWKANDISGSVIYGAEF